MGEPAHLLARLDRLISQTGEISAELRELRDAVAADRSCNTTPNDADELTTSSRLDLSPDDLLDTHAACERFGYPADTIRKWCRTEGLGVMQGGRWLVSVPRLQRRINGK